LHEAVTAAAAATSRSFCDLREESRRLYDFDACFCELDFNCLAAFCADFAADSAARETRALLDELRATGRIDP
jgi:hypothetical protein